MINLNGLDEECRLPMANDMTMKGERKHDDKQKMQLNK